MSNNLERYVSLAKNCFLKKLEENFLYNIATDELYSLNDEAFSFFSDLDGTKRFRELSNKHQIDEEAFNYSLEEKLIEIHPDPRAKRIKVATFPASQTPSLRYLHVLITRRCNLSCKHCYLGNAREEDMNVELFKNIIEEFEQIGGLRLIVSGGEPTEHQEFEKINSLLEKRSVRGILLTNGLRLSDASIIDIKGLNFDEIQISIDGVEDSHNMLRGEGTFDAAIKAARRVVESGKELSVATMITRYNRHQFDRLRDLVNSLSVKSWLIDFPIPEGRAALTGIMPKIEDCELMNYSFGSEVHEGSDNHICGTHLASIKLDGTLLKCDYFLYWTGGNAKKGLLNAWMRLPRILLTDLQCDCRDLKVCRGGCRYRAELYNNLNRLAPDPVACRLHKYNVGTKPTKNPERGDDLED